MKRSFGKALILLLGIISVGACQTPYRNQVRKINSSKQELIVRFDNENRVDPDDSRTKLNLEKGITYRGAATSMRMTTNGHNLEDRLAIKLEPQEVLAFKNAVHLSLVLKFDRSGNKVPNRFFIGLADTTNESFSWKDGVFSNGVPADLGDGWMSATFNKTTALNSISLNRQYTLYVSLWHQAVGNKIPINTNIYFDSLRGEIPVYEVVKVLTQEEEAEKRASDQAFERLLGSDDEKLLNDIQERTFLFFRDNTDPTTGLTVDRYSNQTVASIAASGFYLSVLPVAVEHGWITREAARQLALKTIKSFTSGFVAGRKGFFYHFVDMKTGKRSLGSELSSIDTALLIAGALVSQQYFFESSGLKKEVQNLYDNVEWDWMLGNRKTLKMGWNPENGFLDARWSHFNEGILAYFLAIGSNTHPIPADSWKFINRPIPETNYIAESDGTGLFMFQYPLIWLDLRNLHDDYANYFANLRIVSNKQVAFGVRNLGTYRGFRYGIWGISASDGPGGYRNYTTQAGQYDGTIAPYASISSLPATPIKSMTSIRSMLNVYRKYVYREYGFISAFNPDLDWFSEDYIGVDQGSLFLMIENYRSGLIWRLIKRSPQVQSAITEMGFVADQPSEPTINSRFSRHALRPKLNVRAIKPKFDRSAVNPKFFRATAGRGGYMFSELRSTLYANWHSAPTIDGQLDDNEWADVPTKSFKESDSLILGEYLNTPVELSAQAKVSYDAKNVYVSIAVTDTTVLNQLSISSKDGFYRSDSVEIYLSDSLSGNPVTNKSVKLAILVKDQEGKSRAIRFGDSWPGLLSRTGRGIEYAVAQTQTGYNIEAKIPVRLFSKSKKLQAGQELAFNIVVHNGNNTEAPINSDARQNTIALSILPEPWNNIGRWAILYLQ